MISCSAIDLSRIASAHLENQINSEVGAEQGSADEKPQNTVQPLNQRREHYGGVNNWRVPSHRVKPISLFI